MKDRCKVLAVFSHRPEKVSNILPYSGIDYKVISPPLRKNRKVRTHKPRAWYPLLRLLVMIPNAIRMKYSRKRRNIARDAIVKYNPDIVFTHGGSAAHALMVVTKQLGKKFVMRIGGHPYEEFKDNLKVPGWSRLALAPVHGTHYWFLINNLKSSDHIIVVADDMKKRLVERYGYPSDKISVVPVPIDITKFMKPKLRHKGEIILTIANVNFLPKVRAVREYKQGVLNILRKNRDAHWVLVIPGRYGYLIKRELSGIMPDRIDIIDYTVDVIKYYRVADVVVYLSHLDSVPNIILEAWASRIPVITNDSEWSRELIRHRETGLISNTSDELEANINDVLYGPFISKKMVSNAYDYLISHHTEDIAGKRLGEVLRSI